MFQQKAICISALYFSYKSYAVMLYIAAFYILGISLPEFLVMRLNFYLLSQGQEVCDNLDLEKRNEILK